VRSDAEAALEPPLVVDLDGTLLRTDMLYESAVRLLRANPLYIFVLPFWLLAGRHVLKRELARRVDIDVALLPRNEAFVDHLQAEAGRGRTLVLATASHELLARRAYEHWGLFQDLLCTGEGGNLKGPRKRDALLARFGPGGFDYAGNDAADLQVWGSARRALVVNASASVERRARALGNTERVFRDRSARAGILVRSWRVHQWAKNLLVFVPLLAAHLWGDADALMATMLTFTAFCLCASAIYQLNDLLDLDADRKHPRKRLRPIASGRLSIPLAFGSAIALGAGGLAIAAAVSFPVLALLVGYIGLTTAYSYAIKKQAVVDVVTLAALYTVRIIAGAAAVEVVPSFWLLAFSMFLFLSLGTLKRCAELLNAPPEGRDVAGRGYRAEDLPYLTGFGAAAGTGSVVILALFVNSVETTAHYSRPELLWLLCTVLVYWIGRMWLKTGRGEMHDDPVVFAAKDAVSRWSAAIALACIVLAF
jgi:4-hydroxybenzoate polyprenyltransferase